jgi:hypothetical protein
MHFLGRFKQGLVGDPGRRLIAMVEHPYSPSDKYCHNRTFVIHLSTLFVFSLSYLAILLYSFPLSAGPDGADFLKLGHNLKTYHRFALSEASPLMYDRVPGYPVFIAICMYFPGTIPALYKVLAGQVLVTSLSALVIGMITARVFCPRWAFTAGFLFVVYRGTVFSTCTVTRESLAGLLLYLAALATLSVKHTITRKPMAATLPGAVFATASLCREDTTTYMLIALIFLLTIRPGHGMRSRSLTGMFFTVGFFLVMSPWIVRNYVQANRFLLLSTAGGTEFYAGNNANVAVNGIDYGMAPSLRKASTVDAFETDAKYRHLALEFVRKNPTQFVSNFIAKVKIFLFQRQSLIDGYVVLFLTSFAVYLLSLRFKLPCPGLASVIAVAALLVTLLSCSINAPAIVLLASGSYGYLFLFGSLGAAIAIVRRPDPNWFLPTIYIVGVVIAGLIIPQYRQRYVIDGILCIYACFLLDYIYSHILQ